MVKMAAAQYPIDKADSWEAIEKNRSTWILEAVKQGAQLLLFPEYAGFELLSLVPDVDKLTHLEQLQQLQRLLPQWTEGLKNEASKHQCYIMSGTVPYEIQSGYFVNRAFLVSPSGKVGVQDKLMMTRFENEKWIIKPNVDNTLNVFKTPFGNIGIAICYDSEFPAIVQALVMNGADIILVPSCTDTTAGFNRVKVSCQARALENQCYVVQSPLVGDVPWLDVVDTSCGQAGVFTPIDIGCPDDGVLTQGEWNKPQWVYAEVLPRKLSHIRRGGQVLNYRDNSQLISRKLQIQSSEL